MGPAYTDATCSDLICIEQAGFKGISYCIFALFAVSSVEGSQVSLTRVTRGDSGAYLCIASNGVPSPVSKRIMLYVHCKWFPNVVYYFFTVLKK